MLNKKVILGLIAGAAVLGVSSVALADSAASGPYIGAQIGAGDNHANDFGADKHIGLAGGVDVGYDFNQYVAAEAGYTYLGKVDDVTTQAGDLVGKIHVPVVGNAGLFAKAGAGYLRSSFDHDAVDNVNLVYGFGADYKVLPNLVADVSFTRFNGNSKIASSNGDINNNFQPNADFYAVGMTYKFNA